MLALTARTLGRTPACTQVRNRLLGDGADVWWAKAPLAWLVALLTRPAKQSQDSVCRLRSG
jgi:hypothetical protein